MECDKLICCPGLAVLKDKLRRFQISEFEQTWIETEQCPTGDSQEHSPDKSEGRGSYREDTGAEQGNFLIGQLTGLSYLGSLVGCSRLAVLNLEAFTGIDWLRFPFGCQGIRTTQVYGFLV